MAASLSNTTPYFERVGVNCPKLSVEHAPWFSICLSTYNRSAQVVRAVESCIRQEYDDFEIVVVDDGSTDETLKRLSEIDDSRLHIIRHDQNLGICAARHSAAVNARGNWIITLDSDHALLPGALANLYARTASAEMSTGIVGSRYSWSDGSITPKSVPKEAIDYEGRLKWIEAEGGTDYLCCYRRKLYGQVIWRYDKRGPLDCLFQLELARCTNAVIGEDIIAMEYTDGPESVSRGRGISGIRNILRTSSDMAWQYDEILRVHGEAIIRIAPRLYASMLRAGALYHFLAGKRSKGIRYALLYLWRMPMNIRGYGILVLGVCSRFILAAVKLRR